MLMKYVFSIYVILVFGCTTSLYANNSKDAVLVSLSEVTNQSNFNDSDLIDAHLNLILKTFHSTVEAEGGKIRATDNEVAEEEESVSVRREVITSTYFSTVRYAEQLGCLCNNIKKRLPRSKFFVHFPSNRMQIVFNVFLI